MEVGKLYKGKGGFLKGLLFKVQSESTDSLFYHIIIPQYIKSFNVSKFDLEEMGYDLL